MTNNDTGNDTGDGLEPQQTETIQQEIERNVSISSPQHLKSWLQQTGREYLVFKTSDLIDALPWPEGVKTLIWLVEAYRQHRQGIPVGYQDCPRLKVHKSGDTCRICRNFNKIVKRAKSDYLELDEIDDAIRFLELKRNK